VRSTVRPWLAILLFFSTAASGWAATSDTAIKAVFLFHFTQFVEWPQGAFASANAPFVIGILGADPLEPILAGVVQGEAVGQHPIVVRDLRNEDEASKCQIVYVTKRGEGLLDPRRLQNAPVLTVGESDAFFRRGGTIQLFFDRRHVRLRINLAAARIHSLVISAKLLRVADVSGEPSALELPSSLAEEGPLDLLLLRAGHSVLGMGGVQEILANDR
jgi:YfiR/HmsC-like